MLLIYLNCIKCYLKKSHFTPKLDSTVTPPTPTLFFFFTFRCQTLLLLLLLTDYYFLNIFYFSLLFTLSECCSSAQTERDGKLCPFQHMELHHRIDQEN